MMHATVVYESMFGNTERVAQAIAAGLGENMVVHVLRADPGMHLGDDIDLLVVGAPTHAFSMSRKSTRASAGQQGAVGDFANGPGLREWIDALPARGAVAPTVATFDTRIKKRGIPGSAARAAQKKLHGLGLPVLAPAMSFWVSGTTGPLLAGEADRARSWGKGLAEQMQRRQSTVR
jgi:hypothetical protein